MAGLRAQLASRSMDSAIKSNKDHDRAYQLSFGVLPDLSDHYTGVDLSPIFEKKGRFLLSAQAAFVADQVREVLGKKGTCELADIGDSDGSLQLMIKSMISADDALQTTGINLQSEAVEKIRAKGLDAEHADAMQLAERGRTYDVTTVMETLEHLPNPIGFLESMHEIVQARLVISVPYLRRSRVSLRYLDEHGPGEREPTIENVHIFELCPVDWQKIFLHAGWKLHSQRIAYQFGPRSVWRLAAPVWRRMDFEGFWLASFTEDFSARQAYSIDGA